MTEMVRIVLPDTGPLITLAQAGALDVLLVFNPERVQLVMTDMVEFEASRRRSTHEDAQAIADFIERHAGRITVQATAFGQMAISAARVHERYTQSQQVRDFYAANQMPAPAALSPNSGELSIVSYVTELIGQPPGPPCLVIAEDDFFLRSLPGALPGNAHIISTMTLLEKVEELNPAFKARQILEAARRFSGREPNPARVDRPAAKIPGGTAWDTGLLAVQAKKPAAGRKSAGKPKDR